MTEITRREFLAGAGAVTAAMLGGLPARAIELAGAPSFEGSRPGEARSIEQIEMRWCADGRFRMGSPPGEPERRPDESQVDVRITHGFWITKYAVTQGQWTRVMGRLPGALTAGTGDASTAGGGVGGVTGGIGMIGVGGGTGKLDRGGMGVSGIR